MQLYGTAQILYGTKNLSGKIFTNGPCSKFDQQNFDEFIAVFIEKVLQRKLQEVYF